MNVTFIFGDCALMRRNL